MSSVKRTANPYDMPKQASTAHSSSTERGSCSRGRSYKAYQTFLAIQQAVAKTTISRPISL